MKLEVLTNNRKVNTQAMAITVAMALVLNVVFWLNIFTMIKIPATALAVAIAAFAPIAFGAVSYVKKIGRYSLYFAILIVALALLIFADFFSTGFVALSNQVIEVINSKNGLTFLPLAFGKPGMWDTSVTGSPAKGLIALLEILTGAIFAINTKNKNILLTTITVAIPIFAGMFFGLSPRLLYALLLLVVFAMIIVLCSIKNDEGLNRLVSLSGQVVGSLIVFLLLASFILSSFSSLPLATKVRERADKAVYSMRYEPKTDEEIAHFPKGNLREAKSIEFTDNVAFNITMQHPSSAYFKQYVGERFVNGEWKGLDVSAYTGKYLGIFQWLDSRNFYEIAQLSRVYAADASRTGSAAIISTVNIRNVGEKSDVLITPYEIIPDVNADNDYTKTILKSKGFKGQRNYTYNSYVCLYNDYASSGIMNSVATEMVQSEEEKAYRSFVYDNYLSVDGHYSDMLAATNIDAYNGKQISDITYYIRQFFETNYKYNTEVSEYNADPLVHFALNSREGYDPYFASLATLMFRRAGVPARYVEGYYLSYADMEGYMSVDNSNFDVYDSSAHAWVEIYLDGVGFVPVEVTPGFYTLTKEENDNTTTKQEKFTLNDDQYYHDDVNTGKNELKNSNDSKLKLSKALIVLLIIAAVIALLALAVFLLYRYIITAIKKADSAKSTYHGLKLIRACWMVRNRKKFPDDPYSIADDFGEDKEKYTRYLDLVYKEKFSENGLSADERKSASENALVLANILIKGKVSAKAEEAEAQDDSGDSQE